MKVKFLGQSFKWNDLVHIIPRLIIAIILAQTLPFKFSGAEESVWIFTQLNMEPWGRYFIASCELIATILLITNYYVFGAVISLSIISAANFFHFVRLGFDINGDGGTLFILSIVVIICSLWIVLYWNLRRLESKTAGFQFKSEGDDLIDDDLDEITS